MPPFIEGKGATCCFSLTPGEQVCEQEWAKMGFRTCLGCLYAEPETRTWVWGVYVGGDPGERPQEQEKYDGEGRGTGYRCVPELLPAEARTSILLGPI